MKRDIRPAESVSEAVVQAVSSAEDRPPRALPSLYSVVNPEALDALFQDKDARDTDERNRVSFQFSDSTVTVRADRCIQVEQRRTTIDTR